MIQTRVSARIYRSYDNGHRSAPLSRAYWVIAVGSIHATNQVAHRYFVWGREIIVQVLVLQKLRQSHERNLLRLRVGSVSSTGHDCYPRCHGDQHVVLSCCYSGFHHSEILRRRITRKQLSFSPLPALPLDCWWKTLVQESRAD